jgi:ATP-dependent DNA ligase
MPKIESPLRLPDHIERRGADLFRVACDRDLEGIVGKWASGTYRTDGRATSWVKLKNRDYSQMTDRHELFAPREQGPQRPHSPRRLDFALR